MIETPLTAPIKAQAAWHQAYADKNIMKRWGRAEEMVGPTLFLESDAASYDTGTILYADGGWLAVDGRFTRPECRTPAHPAQPGGRRSRGLSESFQLTGTVWGE